MARSRTLCTQIDIARATSGPRGQGRVILPASTQRGVQGANAPGGRVSFARPCVERAWVHRATRDVSGQGA
eukprot:7805712-Lingulodinium_polyedra.AAC.1